MDDSCDRIPFHDSHLASRKAEEAALRRFQAATWIEWIVGPLGLSQELSEGEFISCLRNGIVLCNALNKIQPGAVPKVVENHSPSFSSEFQSLPARQYFENVRNFLVAVDEMKLPAFEASALEGDKFEAGSTAKIVDCILALKCYHEWKQCGGIGNGSSKCARSPSISHSAGRIHSHATSASPGNTCRRLDLSAAASEKTQLLPTSNSNDSVNSVTKVLADCMYDTKENLSENLLASFQRRNPESLKSYTKIISSCFQEGKLDKYPELQSILKELLVEGNGSSLSPTSAPLENLSRVSSNYKCCKSCLSKGECSHQRLIKAQEKDLMELKALLSRTKKEFKTLQLQLQNDLMNLGSQVKGLCTAALGYHQAVKENRTLYNTLQDLKGKIRVYCRIRPALSAGSATTVDIVGDGSLIIIDPLKGQKDSRKRFQFNKVFGPTATQEEVFKDTRPLIRSVMDGYNVCIFAYGQTGSGKTHTMFGSTDGSGKDIGINYLALNDLFQISCDRKDVEKYEFRVQMVEIYNEQVRDLLAEDGSSTKLEIRSCTNNGASNLPHAKTHLVGSTMDVINLVKLGEINRFASSTAMNNKSSRSHSLLTIYVQGKDTSESIIHSCLHLVDLAGSERVDKSEVRGDRLKEAQHINKSLSCLGDVITALAQKNSHIPYRNSKLTQLLQDSLGGQAKTLMFAHVSPEADSFEETISTLKFAQRVSTVELSSARLNKETSDIQELKEQIESLKKELARKGGNKVQVPKSPSEKMKTKSEHTLPRPRRLSIENSTAVKPEQFHMSCITEMAVEPYNNTGFEDENGNSRSEETNEGSGNCNRMSTPAEVSHNCDVSHSNAACHSQILKDESGLRAPLILQKSPKTPVPVNADRELQIPCLSSTNRKGSQIRKSFQNIGKLISSSQKRNDPPEICSPVYPRGHSNGQKSPRPNARVHRRQSLTGVPASGLTTSRRSSLGGKSTDSYSRVTRNSRTPPPVHPSLTKRWL